MLNLHNLTPILAACHRETMLLEGNLSLIFLILFNKKEHSGLVVTVSASRPNNRGFEPHQGHDHASP